MSSIKTSSSMSGASDNKVGAVETRGIEPVPDDERRGNPLQLFWVWFAANISILALPLGATLVALRGLNIWQAVLVGAIGSFGSFAVVGLISVAGKWGGAPSMTLSRAVFGPRGNRGPTVVSWLSRVGWEVVNTTTAAYALLAILHIAFGVGAGSVLTIVCLLAFVILTLLVSGLGHATLVWVQQQATYVFGALNLVVAGFLVTKVHWHAVLHAPAAPTSAVIAGIGIIAGGTGIGWANAGADMARYQPRRVSGRRIVAAASAGAGIPLVVLIALGGLLSADDHALAAASDPVAAIQAMLPSWMAIPYLLAAFGGLLLSNHLSVYSAGLTMITLGIRLRRTIAVGVDIVLILTGGIYLMLIAKNFYGPFITFISLLAVAITSWVAVFLVDMIRRRDYDPAGLMDTTRTGRYWHHSGVAWSAFIAWIAGIVTGLLFTVAETSDTDVWFAGPLSKTWAGRNGLGWLVAFAVAAAIYLALQAARGSTTRTQATEPAQPVGRAAS